MVKQESRETVRCRSCSFRFKVRRQFATSFRPQRNVQIYYADDIYVLVPEHIDTHLSVELIIFGSGPV